MSNRVSRPLAVDPDGTFDSRYWTRNDPMAQGPQGPEGPQGPQGPAGATGAAGAPGQAVNIRWTVANAGLLTGLSPNIGDGALVGASAPYSLYIYINPNSPYWLNAGTVTAGPQGPAGPAGATGATGPQPALAGSGSATTAARSDHNHNGVYSPVGHNHTGVYAPVDHNHSAADITSGTLGAARLPNHSADLLTSGTLGAARLPGHSAALLTSGTLDEDRISSLSASKLTGTINGARLPNISASIITAGTVAYARLPVGTSSGTVSAGNHTHSGYAATSHTHSLSAVFPNNDSVTSTANLRVGPGNTHAVISSLSTGHALYNAGMTVTTDESWTYVFSPARGFGWFPTANL